MKPEELAVARDEALALAERAGELVMGGYRNAGRVHKKSATDLLTEYDLASEKLLCESLRARFPDHRVVGEETSESTGTAEPEGTLTWYVDPIDGTTNFVHGHPFFAISLGLCRDGEPLVGVIVAPALGVRWAGAVGLGATRNGEACKVSTRTVLLDTLLATGFPVDRAVSPENNYREFEYFTSHTRGVRRCGAAALDLALTADGTFDGYWEFKLKPWDSAGGAALVMAAGGKVTDDRGKQVDLRQGSLVASNGLLHPVLLETLSQVRDEHRFPQTDR